MSYANNKVKYSFFNNQGDISIRQMIRFGQVSNSSKIPSLSILSANFRKIQSKLKELCWWESNRGFFSNQGDVTLRLMRFLTHLRFQPCPAYLQISGKSYQNRFLETSDFLVSKYVLQNYLFLSENCKNDRLGKGDRGFQIFYLEFSFLISPPVSNLKVLICLFRWQTVSILWCLPHCWKWVAGWS